MDQRCDPTIPDGSNDIPSATGHTDIGGYHLRSRVACQDLQSVHTTSHCEDGSAVSRQELNQSPPDTRGCAGHDDQTGPGRRGRCRTGRRHRSQSERPALRLGKYSRPIWKKFVLRPRLGCLIPALEMCRIRQEKVAAR